MNDHLDPAAVKALFDHFPTLKPVRGRIGDHYKYPGMDSTACLVGAVGQFVNHGRRQINPAASTYDIWNAMKSILPNMSKEYFGGLWRGWDSCASPAEIRRRTKMPHCDEHYLGWIHGALAARAVIEKDIVLETPA